MEQQRDDDPKFDEQDSGAPVTTPDRNPDPPAPEHSVPEGAGGGESGGGSLADHVRDQRAGDLGGDADEEPRPSVADGPAVPDRDSGLESSNPAEGL